MLQRMKSQTGAHDANLKVHFNMPNCCKPVGQCAVAPSHAGQSRGPAEGPASAWLWGADDGGCRRVS